MIKLDEFDGHIVLYCKGWYFQKDIDVDFLVGLRRIWAIRCGYDYIEEDKSADEYIADRMFKIIVQANPNIDIVHFQRRLHNEMAKDYLSTYQGLNTIEKLIKFYRSELVCLTIVENKKVLIDLPKVKKRVFSRIIKGKGEYNDYKLITS
jgi:hypothetical protein